MGKKKNKKKSEIPKAADDFLQAALAWSTEQTKKAGKASGTTGKNKLTKAKGNGILGWVFKK